MSQDPTSYSTGDLISVHLVSEQIFCPRAMLIAHSRDEDDWGRESPVLRLSYSPSYELQELEQRLEAEARTLWQLLLVAIVLASSGFGLSIFFHPMFFWAGLLAAAIPARYFVLQIRHTLKLLRDHRRATEAPPDEPNPSVPIDQPVNWWSLRAAGFVPQPVDELLTDADLRLKGRPWRILRRGNLAIPAFVRSSTDELRPQQRARIAAYCHLIRANEGAESPYGIVLDRGTFEGLAVRPTDRDRRTMTKALQKIPHALKAWLQENAEPRPPVESDYAVCRNCPHGRPIRYAPEDTDTHCYGRRVPVYPTTTDGKKKVILHSPCGDIFHWIPEHELARSLELRRVVGS